MRSMGKWHMEPSMDYFKSMATGEEGDAMWDKESYDDSDDDSDTEEKLRVAQDMIDLFCEDEHEHELHAEDHHMMHGDKMHHEMMDGDMDHDMMDHDTMDGDMDHGRTLMHHKKDDNKKSHKKTKD